MKVLLKTSLSPFTGYGLDGLGLAKVFADWGADVYLQPIHVDAPVSPTVAALLTKTLEAPFDLGICHVDPGQLEASTGMRSACRMLIGWTMWEMTTLANMDPERLVTLAERLQGFDLLLAYDEVSAQALAPYAGGVPIQVLQGGYDAEDWPTQDRDWYGNRFAFCMVGALHERKNPFTAVQAFNQLQREDEDFARYAELHLKDSSGTLPPPMEDAYVHLRVHRDTWPKETLSAFYGKMHVLLAPSRGEGKNMPCLEFLSTGGTVIATNWGGHQGWLSSDIGYPLDYTLVPMPAFPDTYWAQADLEHLKQLMLHTFRNRAEAKLKGERAAQLIPGMCSWLSVIVRLFDRLAVLSDVGAGTAMLAQVAHRTSADVVGGWR